MDWGFNSISSPPDLSHLAEKDVIIDAKAPDVDSDSGNDYAPPIYECVGDSTYSAPDGWWTCTAKRITTAGETEAGDGDSLVVPVLHNSALRSTSMVPLYAGDRAIEIEASNGSKMLIKIGEATPKPLDVKYYNGTIYVFSPNASDVAKYNGDSLLFSDSGAPSWGWYAWQETTGYSGAVYLEVYLTSGEDYTDTNNVKFRIVDSITESIWCTIANVVVNSGLGYVQQVRSGGIELDAARPDSEFSSGRSLECKGTYGGFPGQWQSYGWDSPSPPNDIESTSIVLREPISGVPEKRYITWEDLVDALEEYLEINYGDLVEAPSTSSGWPGGVDYDIFPPRHDQLSDVMDQTVGDDHRGLRGAVAGVDHAYLHVNGDETRNSVSATMAIGDASDKKVMLPGTRKAYATDGTTVSLDWASQQPAIQNAETNHTTGSPAEVNAALNALGARINELRDAIKEYKIIAEA